MMESETGGELLHMDPSNPKPELQVYTRQKPQRSTTDPNISPATGQSAPLNDSPPMNDGPFTKDNSKSTLELSDLDVPIALRKGTRSCTNPSYCQVCLIKNCPIIIKHLFQIFLTCMYQDLFRMP